MCKSESSPRPSLSVRSSICLKVSATLISHTCTKPLNRRMVSLSLAWEIPTLCLDEVLRSRRNLWSWWMGALMYVSQPSLRASGCDHISCSNWENFGLLRISFCTSDSLLKQSVQWSAETWWARLGYMSNISEKVVTKGPCSRYLSLSGRSKYSVLMASISAICQKMLWVDSCAFSTIGGHLASSWSRYI